MKTVGKNMIKECRHNLTACLENFYSGLRTESRSEKTSLRRLGRIGKTRLRQNEDNNNFSPLHSSVSAWEREREREKEREWVNR